MYSNKTPDSGNQKKMGHFELNLKKRKRSPSDVKGLWSFN